MDQILGRLAKVMIQNIGTILGENRILRQNRFNAKYNLTPKNRSFYAKNNPTPMAVFTPFFNIWRKIGFGVKLLL